MLASTHSGRAAGLPAAASHARLVSNVPRPLPCSRSRPQQLAQTVLRRRGPAPCSAVDASSPAGLQAAIESKLAESLDPDRLNISVKSPSNIHIEVASNTFDGLKVTERVQLVKELLGAELDQGIANAAEVVAMTPREYFASLKKWC